MDRFERPEVSSQPTFVGRPATAGKYRNIVLAAMAATAFNVSACGGDGNGEPNDPDTGTAGSTNTGTGGSAGASTETGGNAGNVDAGGSSAAGAAGADAGDPCANLQFTGLASHNFAPGETGSFEVNLGSQHPDHIYNGTKFTMVHGGLVTRPSMVGLQSVRYDNYLTPGYGKVGDLSGIRPVIVDAVHPYVDDGTGNCKLNLVAVNASALNDPAKQPTIESPAGVYATAFKVENQSEAPTNFALLAEKTRFSLSSLHAQGRAADYVMANSKPRVTAGAQRDDQGHIVVDLAGTTDEGVGTDVVLSRLNANAPGVTFAAVAGQPGKFRTASPSTLANLDLAVAGLNQPLVDDTVTQNVGVVDGAGGSDGGAGGSSGIGGDSGTGGHEAGTGGSGTGGSGTGGSGTGGSGTGGNETGGNGTGGTDAGAGGSAAGADAGGAAGADTGIGGGTTDLCIGVDCSGHGTCAEGACTCAPHFTNNDTDPKKDCDACAPGFENFPSCSPIVVDPCVGVNCNGHGTCAAGACTCAPHYKNNDADPKNDCDACDTGYRNYPTCEVIPAPVISGLGIDCSGGPVPGGCVAGGLSYPVNFNVTDANNCSATVERTYGTGTPGTTSPVVLNGNIGTTDYTTGNQGSNIIRLTVDCIGDGGVDSEFTEFQID